MIRMQLHSPLGHACYTKRGSPRRPYRLKARKRNQHVAIETGNGVAEQEAERLGGASRVGRRRLR